MTVAFFGHRDFIPSDEIVGKLEYTVRDLILKGAVNFLLGGYGSFDIAAARAVKKLKEEYPYIRSTLVLAYLNQEYYPDMYDDTVYPPLESVPKRFAISKRNEWIVERADIIIYYVERGWGGAASAIKKAKRKGKTMISLTNHQ